MDLISLAVFVIVVIAALYLVKYIPDPALANIARIVVVVGAILWIVTNLRALMHLHA